jgi:hypothetical protein
MYFTFSGPPEINGEIAPWFALKRHYFPVGTKLKEVMETKIDKDVEDKFGDTHKWIDSLKRYTKYIHFSTDTATDREALRQAYAWQDKNFSKTKCNCTDFAGAVLQAAGLPVVRGTTLDISDPKDTYLETIKGPIVGYRVYRRVWTWDPYTFGPGPVVETIVTPIRKPGWSAYGNVSDLR